MCASIALKVLIDNFGDYESGSIFTDLRKIFQRWWNIYLVIYSQTAFLVRVVSCISRVSHVVFLGVASYPLRVVGHLRLACNKYDISCATRTITKSVALTKLPEINYVVTFPASTVAGRLVASRRVASLIQDSARPTEASDDYGSPVTRSVYPDVNEVQIITGNRVSSICPQFCYRNTKSFAKSTVENCRELSKTSKMVVK
ncbi:hypothetical protein PUN28_012456 [Cardiocondyla obscurior]|uniref:Uncharacterized protein n=1 Tax=Cardiocondyla obscurior TaxID=286306 RepID=A0AAW2FG05_9HYME